MSWLFFFFLTIAIIQIITWSKGAASRLTKSFCQLRVLLAYSLRNCLWMEKLQFRIKQICIPDVILSVRDNKTLKLFFANKLSKNTVVIHFNFLQVCLSFPLYEFVVLNVLGFQVLNSYEIWMKNYCVPTEDVKLIRSNLCVCLQEVTSSFHLFKLTRSALQMMKYYFHRRKLKRFEAGLNGVDCLKIFQVKLNLILASFKCQMCLLSSVLSFISET